MHHDSAGWQHLASEHYPRGGEVIEATVRYCKTVTIATVSVFDYGYSNSHCPFRKEGLNPSMSRIMFLKGIVIEGC